MRKKSQNIIIRALDGEKNIASPYHQEGFIKHQYIMVDEESRIGYLLFWCDKTFKGINIDRVKVPENVDFIYGKDIKEAIDTGKVPIKIEWVKINRKIWF